MRGDGAEDGPDLGLAVVLPKFNGVRTPGQEKGLKSQDFKPFLRVFEVFFPLPVRNVFCLRQNTKILKKRGLCLVLLERPML